MMVGLPGSGKTHEAKSVVEALNKMFGEGRAQVIDDPKTEEDLTAIGKCVTTYITDPHLCRPEARVAAKAMVKKLYPDAMLCWHFFENDPCKAQKNVLHRNDGRKVEEFIKMLSKVYTIPEGYVPQTIWNP
jgi:hypothetical protein